MFQNKTDTPPLALSFLPPGLRERAATIIPATIAQFITMKSEWYQHNGHYRFQIGEKIDCKGPQYVGYGDNPQGWTVVGHDDDKGMYVIETAEGERQTHFKWNIEYQFKPADPNAKPFDPNRFNPEAGRNLYF